MGNNRNDNGDWQEEKTVSIFGEKTVAENAPLAEEETETTEDGRDDKKGRWLTAIVAAAVVIVGITVIMVWQSKTEGKSESVAEEPVEQEEAAAAEEDNTQDITEEAAVELAVDETGISDAEAENGSDEAKDVETESSAEKKAKKLYDLLAEYDVLRVVDGYDKYMEIIPEGPVDEIFWLMRRYNAGEDIAEVSLKWERYKQAAIYYMDQLQKEEPLEYTYLADETEDGVSIVLYINTEQSIYYIGESSGIYASGIGTVYYDVTVDEATGMTDFYIYDGLWHIGRPRDVGMMIHVVDEINDHDGKLESATNAYCVDQNGNAITFYDIYNNEGGRWAEESEGEYDTDLVPEWEFGEY